VIVRWIDDAGQEYSAPVELGRILKNSEPAAGRLVIRIGAGNELDVHVE
jgi:hypothetical protein